MKALPIEKQVASLEPMQELVGLGLKVESYFVHAKSEGVVAIVPRWYLNDEIESCHYTILAPALTVAELGELLPDTITKDGKEHQLIISKYGGIYHCQYYNFCVHSVVGNSDEQMTNSIALMLIYLIKEGHVTIKELNR